MSYLGNNPNKGSFFQQKLAGDGSTTSFTLLQSVTDGSQLLVTIGNVIQEEGNGKAYTASGATLTFDSAPANGDVIVVRYLGRSLDTPTTYATQITFKYVATNGQTAFTGADANGITLSYTIGSVDVYLNGVHLDTTDFTETNESTLTLASGATTSDEVVIVAKRTITLTDVVPKSAGGTFAGNVIAGGNLTVNGAFTSQGIDDNADATAITITSAELVGISETTPLGKLHVKSGDSGASSVNANANELVIENSDYTGITILGENESNICFGDNEDPDVGRIEYHHSDNSMRFRTNASDRMRITSAGRLGIGTTSPSQSLHIEFSDNTGGQSGQTIKNTNTGTTANFASLSTNAVNGTISGLFGSAHYPAWGGANVHMGSSTNHPVHIISNNAIKATLNSSGNFGIGTTSPSSKMHLSGTQTVFLMERTGQSSGTGQFAMHMEGSNSNQITMVYDDGGKIVFGTASNPTNGASFSEKMNLDSSGNLNIGASSFLVGSSLRNQNGMVARVDDNLNSRANIYFYSGVDHTGGLFCDFNTSSGGRIGSITRASSSSVAYNTSSDYRLKENVDYTFDATTRLKQLKPARFNWIADETNTLVDGFLAHEVSGIIPEAITGEKDATNKDGSIKPQGIDQSKLVPLLVKTLQEALLRIDTLEAEVKALKG